MEIRCKLFHFFTEASIIKTKSKIPTNHKTYKTIYFKNYQQTTGNNANELRKTKNLSYQSTISIVNTRNCVYRRFFSFIFVAYIFLSFSHSKWVVNSADGLICVRLTRKKARTKRILRLFPISWCYKQSIHRRRFSVSHTSFECASASIAETNEVSWLLLRSRLICMCAVFVLCV